MLLSTWFPTPALVFVPVATFVLQTLPLNVHTKMTREGLLWPQMQFFKILFFFFTIVAYVLFQSSAFDMKTYRRFKCNLKHLDGSY